MKKIILYIIIALCLVNISFAVEANQIPEYPPENYYGAIEGWRFDESSGATAENWINSTNKGSLTGFSFNKSIGINGSTDGATATAYVNVSGNLMGGLTTYTVMYWVYHSAWTENAQAPYYYGARTAGNVEFMNYDQSATRFKMVDSSGTECANASQSWALQSWYHLTGVFTSTNMRIYVNGTIVADCQGAYTISGGGLTWHLGNNGPNNQFDLQGGMDDFLVFPTNLTHEQIANISNGSIAPAAPPAAANTTAAPVYSSPTPSDGAYNNTNQTINATGCSTCVFDLWFDSNNPPLTKVLNTSSTANWTMNISADGTYFYRMSAYNTSNGVYSINTTLRNFTLDTTSPTLTINANNFFNSTTNTSAANQYLNTITLNASATDDDNIFAFLYNITKDGVIYFNYSNTSINEKSHNFTRELDITSWPLGVYDIEVSVADGHHYIGGYQIGEYEVSKLVNKITFDTTEGNEISISSGGAYTTTTTREKNSYTMGFNYFLPSDTRTYTIESKDGKIHYIPNSKYKAHFVIWNGKHGNWVDFEGLDGEYTVKKINDYKYEVTFTDLPLSTESITKSIGGLNVVTRNYKWYRGIYNLTAEETYSLVTTDLTLNITINNTYITNVSVDLSYNNTFQSGITRTEYNNHIFFNKTVTAPTVSVDTQVPYFWNITINQSNGNTYNFTANGTNSVLNWGLDNCSLYSTHSINFTIFDEENLTTIPADITGTFNYTIDNVKYRSFDLDQDDVHNFSICITPSNVTLYADYNLYYSAANYPQRRYTQEDDVLTNATSLTNLYLLYTDQGEYVRFRTVDVYQSPIGEVSGKMERSIGGSIVIVESSESDDSGLITFWANTDEDYIFTFSKTGYVTESFTLRPTSSEIYTVTMEEEEDVAELPYAVGIAYLFSPSNTVLNNNTNYTFSFNMTSTYWGITGCNFSIKNSTNYFDSSTSSFNTTNCDIEIKFNTGNHSLLFGEATYELNNTINQTVSMEYVVKYTYVGQFSLKSVLDDLKALRMAGFNEFTLMIIAFIIIFAIIASVTIKIGLREPESLIILGWGLVFFFSYLGWFTLNFETIPEIKGLAEGWLKQYIIFILVTLGAGFYIWRKHTE